MSPPSPYRLFVLTLERALPRFLFRLVYGCYAIPRNTWNLIFGYGQWRTCFSHTAVSSNRAPIPWFTYPAIEYLEGLDLTQYAVFEFGGGNSTRYWSHRAKSVVAIEQDAQWAAHLKTRLLSNAQVWHVSSLDEYPTSILSTDERYDLIIIDGARRFECAQAAPDRLRPGGVIILDDADDHVEAAQVLREANLIEVDFAGFSPIISYTKTTSFFLHPEFRPTPRLNALPLHSACHPKAER